MSKTLKIPDGWRRVGSHIEIEQGDEGLFFVNQTTEENTRIALDGRHVGMRVMDAFPGGRAIVIRRDSCDLINKLEAHLAIHPEQRNPRESDQLMGYAMLQLKEARRLISTLTAFPSHFDANVVLNEKGLTCSSAHVFSRRRSSGS